MSDIVLQELGRGLGGNARGGEREVSAERACSKVLGCKGISDGTKDMATLCSFRWQYGFAANQMHIKVKTNSKRRLACEARRNEGLHEGEGRGRREEERKVSRFGNDPRMFLNVPVLLQDLDGFLEMGQHLLFPQVQNRSLLYWP